jgi:plasmid replication initiation protein
VSDHSDKERTHIRHGKITRIEAVAPNYLPTSLRAFLRAQFQMQLDPSLTHALQQFPSEASVFFQVKVHELIRVLLTAGFQFIGKMSEEKRHKHKHKQKELVARNKSRHKIEIQKT